MAWWREAKFGMFIHWGVYAVPAGYYKGKPVKGNGEWLMNNGKIPMAEYQLFAKEFNPVKFDAERWVQIAKDAGMKYIVITSKHHDGFAMFDSKASDWNIVKATPYGRDPLKDLAAACRAAGIKLGFYYSQGQDWNNGGAASHGKWDKAQDHDMDDYLDKVALPQVREILTNYGANTPAIVWWDTPADITPARAARLNALIKELKPDLITNNRLGGGFHGDTETPEQFIPANGFPGKDWETCMTMNGTWGFKRDDQAWKSPEQLIRNLCDVASKGGNYLLNVGPSAEGEIPQPSIERLEAVGAWMKANGEAIYGSQVGPFKRTPAWGRATRKGGKVYLMVFDWPADGVLHVPLQGKVAKAWLLAKPDAALEIATGQTGFDLKLPGPPPDRAASVIVLQPEGDLTAPPIPPVTPAAEGTITLTPKDAEIVGSRLRVVDEAGGYLGHWTSRKDFAKWDVQVPKTGLYTVTLEYGCRPDDAGSAFTLAAGKSRQSGTVQATKGAQDFRSIALGPIKLEKSERQGISLKAIPKPDLYSHGSLMNVHALVLTPAPEPANSH